MHGLGRAGRADPSTRLCPKLYWICTNSPVSSRADAHFDNHSKKPTPELGDCVKSGRPPHWANRAKQLREKFTNRSVHNTQRSLMPSNAVYHSHKNLNVKPDS